jgi:flagellar hook-length control protein FliK
MIPGILRIASRILSSISESAPTETSGGGFSEVMRNSMQSNNKEVSLVSPASSGQTSSNTTNTTNESANVPDLQTALNMLDPQTLSFMQQAMSQMALIPGMTNQQLQKMSVQLFSGLVNASRAASNSLTTEQLMENLNSVLKNTGFGEFSGSLTGGQLKMSKTQTLTDGSFPLLSSDTSPTETVSNLMSNEKSFAHAATDKSNVNLTSKNISELSTKGFKEQRNESADMSILDSTADVTNGTQSHAVGHYAYYRDLSISSSQNNTQTPAPIAVSDISDTIKTAVDNGTRHLIVRLDPPDLGQVHIRLKMAQGVLTAELKVDSSSTKDVFTSALPQIRASLESSGIRVGEVHVDVRDEYAGDQGAQREQHGQQNHRHQHAAGREQFFEYLA